MRSRGFLLGLSLTIQSPVSIVRSSISPPNPIMSQSNPQHSLSSPSTCTIYPVTLQTWHELKIDDYIRNFPGGRVMKLEDFTFLNKVTNFVCGLGENCLAGQQCSPFQAQLWLTLYGLQEWNLYVNSLYEAVTAAITQVRGM
ncbi:hypothetical protein DFH28DRAFT_281784 [Melampsora americana]|nr:hypothetical protein DFH28DRAFT_281784 [Melampsora americana]